MRKAILDDTQSFDFNGITHEWEKGKNLYDVLKKKCHPDRFSGDLNEKATKIFQSLVKNKYNYQELEKLKEQAIRELCIKV